MVLIGLGGMDVCYNRLDRQPMDVSKATGNAVAVSIELRDVCV